MPSMPGFSTWGDKTRTMKQSLTPAEYSSAYSHGMVDPSYYQPSAYSRNGQTGHDFIKQYGQVPAYASQQVMNGRSQTHMSMMTSRDYNHITPYTSQLASNQSYPPEIPAPLPPIRAQDVMDPLTHYASRSQVPPEPKPKEEKSTGGVAVHLDYDMQVMSDFVAEMSQGMYAMFQSGLCLADIDLMRSINPNSLVSPQYRKYVSQILSSTRLPSSTIMLGLFYLASRMKIVSTQGSDTTSSGSVYRMLTTCLLLGSKFLDDNTFQNRSWAEVSSIPVKDLNAMELEWLFGFEWSIHARMYDSQEGFFMWRDHWLAYEEDSKLVKTKEAHQLPPIDTNISRSHSVRKPLMSPEGPIPAQYQRNIQYDTQWVSPLISQPSPPSAAYSGPTTPDYYNNPTWPYVHAPPAYSRHAWASNASVPTYVPPRSQPPSYQHTPLYSQQYAQGIWAERGHGHSCGCSGFIKCQEHYFPPGNPFGMQAVAC